MLLISTGSLARGDQPLLKNRKNWIPFTWESRKPGSRTFDKAAIIVPFKIAGVDADFTLQFDLGATSSMRYGDSINYFSDRDNVLKTKLDTAKKRFMIQNQMSGGFTTFGTHLGNVKYAFR